MKWYYTIAGSHVHIRVYMNGAYCGNLCFRTEEFRQFAAQQTANLGNVRVDFIDQTPAAQQAATFTD